MSILKCLDNLHYMIIGLGFSVFIAIPLLGQATDTTETKPDYVLPEVIITATRLNQPLQEVPISSAVITKEFMELSPALNVGDILLTQTGIHVRRSNRGAVTTASLRGAQSSQVLVILDGLPINDTYNGVTDLSQWSLDAIEQIEIVRGPTSHLYGANALGGVVNLITRKPEPSRSLTLTYDNLNTWQCRLYAGRGNSDNGAMISAEINRSDGWRGNDDFLHRNVLGKIHASFGKTNVSVSTGFNDSEMGIPGPKPGSTITPKYGNSEVTSLFDNQQIHYLYGLLSVDSRFGNDYHLQFRLRPEQSATVFKSKYDDWYTGSAIITEDQYVSRNLRLSGQLERQFGTNHFLTGFDVVQENGFTEQNTTNEITSEDSTIKWCPSTSSSSLWGEYIWRAVYLTAVLGARLDYHSRFGSHISPSLGFIFDLGVNKIRFSMGKAYRAPAYNDLFWPEMGNPELKVEIGMAYEVGLEHHPTQALSGVIALFRRNVDDMIAWAPTGLNGLWQPSNINHYLLNGFETELNARGNIFNARVSYTYLDARQTNLEVVFSDWTTGDQRLEYVERLAAFVPKHNIGFNLIYTSASLKISLNGNARSAIINYYSDEYLNPSTVISMIEKRIPARIVMNVKASWVLGIIEPFFEIRNLLDTSYCDQFGSQLADNDYPLPGRTCGIGLNIEF